ncbi:Cytochrome c oxidase assembly protein cox11, mitochondrial [Modicella reniformis]|uniref:Cytochrome c oxidase assembly protein cox11, mitochondrial n=1 Tax=Modicella reniformis TaxID=1440133 RepID=A0A9P6SPY0_9FUNG|nr:Cytochrome c oxidase assembly protein cox11, mitochondrial [Modicella reniformis]
MESKCADHTLPSQQHLDDWDLGLLKLIPRNSVSPNYMPLCESDTFVSASNTPDQVGPETFNGIDSQDSTETSFPWNDFGFLDIIFKTPDPMWEITTREDGGTEENNSDSVPQCLIFVRFRSAIVCPETEPQQAVMDVSAPSIADGFISPIYRQYTDSVQASILDEPSATLSPNSAGQTGRLIELSGTLRSSIPTPSSLSSRSSSRMSSSRTSSTSSVGSILSAGGCLFQIKDSVAKSANSPPLPLNDINGDPAAPSAELQIVSNSLLESLELPDDFFDFALTDSAGSSQPALDSEEILSRLMASPETVAPASTELRQRWDTMDLLSSSTCGLNPTLIVTESPVLPMPSPHLLPGDVLGIGHLGGAMGYITTIPVSADNPSFAPLPLLSQPPLPLPPLIAAPPPTLPQTLVNMNGASFQFWLPPREQADQVPLGSRSLLDQCYSRPLESRSQYLYSPPPSHHHQPYQLRQPSQSNRTGGHHQYQCQHQHQHQHQNQLQNQNYGYLQLQVERGYVREATSPPPISSLKRRRRLTSEESDFLLRQFGMNERPTAQERERFAKHLKLDRRTIQVWFQNRRAKLKRDGRVEDGSKMLQGQEEAEEEEEEEEEEEGEGEEEGEEEAERERKDTRGQEIGLMAENEVQPNQGIGIEPLFHEPNGVWDWDYLQRTTYDPDLESDPITFKWVSDQQPVFWDQTPFARFPLASKIVNRRPATVPAHSQNRITQHLRLYTTPPQPSQPPKSPAFTEAAGSRKRVKAKNTNMLYYTCSATGLGGAPMVGETKFAPERLVPRETHRRVKVRFNADTSTSLQWSFQPQQRQVSVLPGETALAFYTAKNNSKDDVIGIATYNVTPSKVAPHFNKIQCFCFEEQKLMAGEQVDMPIFFFLDPEFAEDPDMTDVDTVVLSYTFFKARGMPFEKQPVLAQGTTTEVWPVSPIGSTIWYRTTKEQTIRWNVNAKTPSDQELKVELLTGNDPAAQHIVQSLGTVKAGDKKAKVILNDSLKTGWYTIRLGDSYTAFFQIKADSKETFTATAPGVATTTKLLTTTTTMTVPTSTVNPTTGAITTAAPTPSNNPSAASGIKGGYVLTFAAAFAIAAVLAF